MRTGEVSSRVPAQHGAGGWRALARGVALALGLALAGCPTPAVDAPPEEVAEPEVVEPEEELEGEETPEEVAELVHKGGEQGKQLGQLKLIGHCHLWPAAAL